MFVRVQWWRVSSVSQGSTCLCSYIYLFHVLKSPIQSRSSFTPLHLTAHTVRTSHLTAQTDQLNTVKWAGLHPAIFYHGKCSKSINKLTAVCRPHRTTVQIHQQSVNVPSRQGIIWPSAGCFIFRPCIFWRTLFCKQVFLTFSCREAFNLLTVTNTRLQRIDRS